MTQPSNETLAEMMKGLREVVEIQHEYVKAELLEIKKKQDLTNGKVIKNTSWRLKSIGVISAAMVVIPTVVSLLVSKIFK